MKLKNNYVTQDIGDVQMMVAVGNESESFRGVVKSNATAAFIVNQLKNDTTEEQIVEAMLKEYEVERSIAERDVKAVLEKLRSIGAVQEG